jgi:hypothetical protein
MKGNQLYAIFAVAALAAITGIIYFGSAAGQQASVAGIKSLFIPTKDPWQNLCRDKKPHLQVLSPNGGELYNTGGQMTVTWRTCNSPARQPIGITLEHVMPEGNQAPSDINGSPVIGLSDGTNNDGTETFTVPNFETFPNGNNYRVTVWWWNNRFMTGTNDSSDANFTINN